jgi:hypothetical protein
MIVFIKGYFYHRRINNICGVFDRFISRRHLRCVIIQQRVHGAIDRVRIYQRFVALHIHDDLCAQIVSNLGNAISSGFVISTRHHHIEACCRSSVRNPRVVRSDNRPGNGRSSPRPLGDPHNQWFSADFEQRLAGKTRRTITGRDDCDCFWLGI